ncbi:MAG: phasin family protein [Burkholderiaceae bacterium]
MVKKTTKTAAKAKPDNNQLAAAVKDSAQQIWLAGLGAFAKAQEEGSKVFEALVNEGRDIQKRTRNMTEEKFGEVTGRVGKVAGGLTKQATESWDRLEQVFEDRVARALNRLGVPTNADVQALIARVDSLNKSVQALGGKPARASAARKPTAAVAKAAKAPRAAKGPRAAKAPRVAPVKAAAPRKARAPRKTAAADTAAPAAQAAAE